MPLLLDTRASLMAMVPPVAAYTVTAEIDTVMYVKGKALYRVKIGDGASRYHQLSYRGVSEDPAALARALESAPDVLGMLGPLAFTNASGSLEVVSGLLGLAGDLQDPGRLMAFSTNEFGSKGWYSKMTYRRTLSVAESLA